MLKLVILIKRRPDLTRDQFVDHYEHRHVPLVRSLIPQIVAYRRNYVEPGTVLVPHGRAAELPFDVVTEALYPDRAAYDAMLAAMASPEVGDRLARDEERFMDRTATTLFLVDERADAAS